ncbi:MAG TPA: NlpC/P60 family protein [Flavipsychrobacter sp.]|nr:NlpC/P60 family protein [Flavipsychrobacter sp.]
MQTEILPKPDTLTYDDPDATYINTGIVKPGEVVVFAQTLKGVPYQYASCSPESGFDCSGFVYYVFEHFKIKVPRSSRDFTDIGKTIEKEKTKPGDLILFTGTNSKNPEVGHIVLCCQMKTIAWYLFTLLPVRRIV